MLMLNKEKEKDLVKKYGFKPYSIRDKKFGYSYGKTFTIYASDCDKQDWACKVEVRGLSKLNADMLYDLIKDDVIINAEQIGIKNKNNSVTIDWTKHESSTFEKHISQIY